MAKGRIDARQLPRRFRVRTANPVKLSRSLPFIESRHPNTAAPGTLIKTAGLTEAVPITVTLSFIKMAFIKQENQPDAYFPDYQDTTFESSLNNTTNQGFGPVIDQVAEKNEPVDPQVDWTSTDPADQLFEIPADNGPNLNLGADQVSSRLDEIKALYGYSTFFESKRIDSMTG